jgi:predicted MFS family arabinose efflux permease
MGSLVYAFVSASQNGWGDGTTLACFAAALVMLVAFVTIESRTAQPITPLHMFADRNRASIYVMAFCITGALMGLFFFLTLFLQNILRYDPVDAGLAFLPVSVGVIATAGAASVLVPRTGPKPLLMLGAALNAVAFAWLAQLSADSGYLSGVFVPLTLFGIGTGLIFVPLTMLGVSNVAPEESGAASSLLNATQQVGGALGLAILVSVFSAAQRREMEQGVTDPGAILAGSISTVFLVTVGISLVALVVGAVAIRAGKESVQPMGFPLPDLPAEQPAIK